MRFHAASWLCAVASVQPFFFLVFFLHKVARNFPSVMCMQSTGNKHSVSQCEKRARTSLFCLRRKRPGWNTPAARQSRGHAIGAARLFNSSPASEWAHTESSSVWPRPLYTLLAIGNMRRTLCEFATGSARPYTLCNSLKWSVQNTRRTHGGMIELQTHMRKREAGVQMCRSLSVFPARRSETRLEN